MDLRFCQALQQFNVPCILLIHFFFQLFFIFVWAKLFGEAFERMHLPAVLGEILAGVLLGPYGARLVVPTDAIYAIAGISARYSSCLQSAWKLNQKT